MAFPFRLFRLSRHPVVGALALGVYATSWSYFGSVGFASREGWQYLAIYIGVTASCALIPLVWAPLHRLTREREKPVELTSPYA